MYVCKVVGMGLKAWRYVYEWIPLDVGGCMYVVAMEEYVGCGLDAGYCVQILILATVQVCVDAGCLVRCGLEASEFEFRVR